MTKRECPDCGFKNGHEADTCSRCGHTFPWRRSVGIKGLNRITVYERRVGGPMQILWYDREGQHRETLKNLADVPIYDKEKAHEIAVDSSRAQRSRREGLALGTLFSTPEKHTVAELFNRLHRDRGSEWSVKWARDQRRYRKFWERVLRPNTILTEVTPSIVEAAVRGEVAQRRRACEAWESGAHDTGRPDKPWSLKTQNHYLNVVVETFGYAETHLKWITPQQNLAAVKRHKVYVDNEELSYQTAEVFQLLPALSAIDLRAWVCGELSYVGGRRLSAIRLLEPACYSTDTRFVHGEPVAFGVVTFPAKTDKARRKGAVYLFGPPKDALEALLATPAVKASGLLFPKGELRSNSPPAKPITEKVLRTWLREAEAACDIEQRENRAFHGFNRRFATDAADPMAASSQSGKTEETLRKIYRQPKPEEKAALAMQLDGLRRGA